MAVLNVAAFLDGGQSRKKGKMKVLYLTADHLFCDVNKSPKMRWMVTLPWSCKVPSTCSTHLIDPLTDGRFYIYFSQFFRQFRYHGNRCSSVNIFPEFRRRGNTLIDFYFFFKVFYTPPSPRSITFHANNMVGESGKKKNSSPWQRYELSVRILWNMARRSILGIPFANLAQRPSNRLPWQRVRLRLLKMALNQCPVTWQWSDHQLICDYFWGAVHAHAVSRAYRSIRTEMKAPDGVAVAVGCGRIRIPPDGSAGRGRQVKKVVRVDKCGS